MNTLKTCQNCKNEVEVLYEHHVIPKVMGGQLLVRLCGDCHAIVHNSSSLKNVSLLTRIGLERAKERGVILGRRRGSFSKKTKLSGKNARIKDWLHKGVSISSMARIFGVNRGTLYNYIKTRKLR